MAAAERTGPLFARPGGMILSGSERGLFTLQIWSFAYHARCRSLNASCEEEHRPAECCSSCVTWLFSPLGLKFDPQLLLYVSVFLGEWVTGRTDERALSHMPCNGHETNKRHFRPHTRQCGLESSAVEVRQVTLWVIA